MHSRTRTHAHAPTHPRCTGRVTCTCTHPPYSDARVRVCCRPRASWHPRDLKLPVRSEHELQKYAADVEASCKAAARAGKHKVSARACMAAWAQVLACPVWTSSCPEDCGH